MTLDEIIEIKVCMKKIADILLNSDDPELAEQGVKIWEISQVLDFAKQHLFIIRKKTAHVGTEIVLTRQRRILEDVSGSD